MFKGNLELILKGAVIGGTMLIPGVSGGTMAIMLGLYDRLIRAEQVSVAHALALIRVPSKDAVAVEIGDGVRLVRAGRDVREAKRVRPVFVVRRKHIHYENGGLAARYGCGAKCVQLCRGGGQ